MSGAETDSEAVLLKFDAVALRAERKTTSDTPWIPILGNPNCGKTALFNRLTGLHHKVGNYPGITVEKKSGWLRGHKILIRDFPGTYSLNAKSMDEKIVSDMVQSWRNPENRPAGVVVVIDATNLTRNIYLALQILDWQIPTIIVLNMIDEVRKKNIRINDQLLKERLNAFAVIPTSAKSGEGIPKLIEAITQLNHSIAGEETNPRILNLEQISEFVSAVDSFLKSRQDRLGHHSIIDTLRTIGEPNHISYLKPYLTDQEFIQLEKLVGTARINFSQSGVPYQTLEQASRYAFIDIYLVDVIGQEKVDEKNISEKIDVILTHKFFGPVILVLVLVFIFNAIFSWAQWPMEQIASGISWLSQLINNHFADGLIRSLVVDGIISGVGSILVFFPQILLLVFFLGLLEDSGYMSRMAFMMDKLMHKIGLHGRSVLPLLSGFACAIPAVMASRTIENWRDRIQTIMMIPLMSCSARLPVYTILIAALIPQKTFLGVFSLQGFVLMGIYFLGMFTAILAAFIVRKIRKPVMNHSVVMELPPYRTPMLLSMWWQVYERGKIFLVNAGTIILAISIILWFLATFPMPPEDESNKLSAREKIEQSYAGKIGHAIEPLIRPLGFDWKIGVGLITSFAAREVIISTLSTLYNLEEEEGGFTNLIEAIQKDQYDDGRPVFNALVGISLMVFFAYAAQCMGTFAVVKRETNSWKWPLLMVAYMTLLAYVASLIVYQAGALLGFA